MVITVVDQGGNMVAMHRMDDSLLASISISYSKAYTAAALRAPTEDAARDILPGQLYTVSSRLILAGSVSSAEDSPL